MNYGKKAILVAGVLLCFNFSMYSQNISLKINNVSVKKAMTELQTKSGYSFVYIADDVDTKKNVSVDASQLDEAIKQILAGQDVAYEIQGKNIIIKKIVKPIKSDSAKKQKITGVVKDANGEPVIGATIIEKGTNNGTVTDYGQNTLHFHSSIVHIRNHSVNPNICLLAVYHNIHDNSSVLHCFLCLF